MIQIEKVEVSVYRYPLTVPVRTSFGIMRDRPMVLVTLTTADGVIGRGEIWCNFPNVGAEHRARLVEQVLAPLITSGRFETAGQAFDHLSDTTWVLGLQTGEQGPLAQSVAGIETAFCDIEGKLKNLPIWKLFGGQTDIVPIYASGIGPDEPEKTIAEAMGCGFRAFKLKVGFGSARDTDNLTRLCSVPGDEHDLMVDANQAWNLKQALAMVERLNGFNLKWLEEPIAADRPHSEWQRVRDLAKMPLAAGENIQGQRNFDALIRAGIIGVVQPDLAKWGGVGKTVAIARKAIATGRRYCPHYLGGGVGLVASAHALAAVGGNGMLEVDINPNPLRTDLTGNLLTEIAGRAYLGSGAGLGYVPDLRAVEKFRILHLTYPDKPDHTQ